MRLIIKGNMVDAILAASSHGVILDNPTTHKPGTAHAGETIVLADTAADETLVRSWYIEAQSAPLYPAGALLFYSDLRSLQTGIR